MVVDSNPPTNVEPAGSSAPPQGSNGQQDYAQQWAAAAAMQSYYGQMQPQQKQPHQTAAAANGQQQQQQAAAANAYYAQMAQHPNLYAQMWAGPVRAGPFFSLWLLFLSRLSLASFVFTSLPGALPSPSAASPHSLMLAKPLHALVPPPTARHGTARPL